MIYSSTAKLATCVLSILSLVTMSKSSLVLYWDMFPKSNEIMLTQMSFMILMSIFIKSFSKNSKGEGALMMWTVSAAVMACILSFLLSNKLMFFIMFEVSMIPMFVSLISLSKEKSKISSAITMILINMSMAVPVLMFILKEFNVSSTLSGVILEMANTKCEGLVLMTLSIVMLLSKVPIFFLHVWLPKAHVESYTLGSMILAGLMLKLGIVGILKMIPTMESKFSELSWMVYSISWTSVAMCLNMMMRSVDVKKVAATSSIAHMGMAVNSILSLKGVGCLGAFMVAFSHGLVSSAMFYIIGTMYEKNGSRDLLSNSSMESVDKAKSMLWVTVLLLNVGIPPTMNFFSEVMMVITFISMEKVSVVFLCMSMMIISSASMVVMVKAVFGKKEVVKTKSSGQNSTDLMMMSMFMLILVLEMLLI